MRRSNKHKAAVKEVRKRGDSAPHKKESFFDDENEGIEEESKGEHNESANVVDLNSSSAGMTLKKLNHEN